MAKYLETQRNDLIIKVFYVKTTWKKDNKVFMSHELAKQFRANHYGNEIKIYQS
jgi:hypothetical protein